jgi:heat shock protein 5
MRNTIEDKEKLADKIDADDKSKISDALTEAQDWLNSNDDAEKDDFEEHLKELQRVCDPIIGKVYENNGGQGQGGSSYDDEEFEDL